MVEFRCSRSGTTPYKVRGAGPKVHGLTCFRPRKVTQDLVYFLLCEVQYPVEIPILIRDGNARTQAAVGLSAHPLSQKELDYSRIAAASRGVSAAFAELTSDGPVEVLLREQLRRGTRLMPERRIEDAIVIGLALVQ